MSGEVINHFVPIPRRPGWRPRPVTADIYSQLPDPEEKNEYEEDSFVAGDWSSDVEMDSALDELDLIGETEQTCVMVGG